MKCLICNSKNVHNAHADLYICRDCDCIFREKDIDYKKEYIDSGYHFDAPWLKNNQKGQFLYMKEDIVKGKTIEFGACWGDLANEVALMNIGDVYVSDLKAFLRKEYKKNIKGEFVGTFEQVTKNKFRNTFSNVIMNNVIEHLNNPKAAFERLRRILKKGGRFLFITENGDDYFLGLENMILHGEHRFLLTKRAIDVLCKKHGFKIVNYQDIFFGNALYVAIEKL